MLYNAGLRQQLSLNKVYDDAATAQRVLSNVERFPIQTFTRLISILYFIVFPFFRLLCTN